MGSCAAASCHISKSGTVCARHRLQHTMHGMLLLMCKQNVPSAHCCCCTVQTAHTRFNTDTKQTWRCQQVQQRTCMLPIDRSMLTATSELPVTFTTCVASSPVVEYLLPLSSDVTELTYAVTQGCASNALGPGRCAGSRVIAANTKSRAPGEMVGGKSCRRKLKMSLMVPCCTTPNAPC
jgi:hypothetical protein